jgi:hypothetical protein
MSDLIDKIKNNIKQSGFLTELKVAQILKSKTWKLSFNQSYQDFDENKSREIDIVAYKVYNDLDIEFQMVINLYIEVKREIDHPWVVFMTEWDHQWPTYGWSILHCGEGYHKGRSTVFSPKDLDTSLLIRSDRKFGTAFYEAFKKTESYPKIFKAIIGASKAAYFGKETWGEHPDNLKFDPKKGVVIEFMIPLVFVEGQLFEVHLDNHDLDIRSSTWLPIKLNYSSPRYVKENRHDLTFYPFISKVDGLSIFLDIIEQWISLVFSNFQRSVKLKRE